MKDSILLVSQTFLGIYSIGQGGCALVDAVRTPLIPAKILYTIGGTLQIVSGIIMLIATGNKKITSSKSVSFACFSISLRKIGNYIVDTTYTIPCFQGTF
jgi:hypothetical protein